MQRDPLARSASAPATDAETSASRKSGRLTIFSKVLIANVAIVVLGAIAGTWITVVVARRESDTRFVPLAAVFAVAGILLSLAVNLVALRAAFRPLARLQAAALSVRSGNLDARADQSASSDPQIRALAETLNAMLDEIAGDRIELNRLATQVIRAQEDERRRIARELHDDTAQLLFAQLLRLSVLKGSDDPTVQSLASSLEEMTSEALEGVRRLALELRPPALDDLGLQAALGELAQRYADQFGIRVDYQARGVRGRLDPDAELVLYRIAQEALTNIAKHADARLVTVDLDRTRDDVTISVRDDGIGFDPASAKASDDRGLGLGLFGMEERASLLGGRLRIWSRPGAGTEVFAYLPLRFTSSGQYGAAFTKERRA